MAFDDEQATLDWVRQTAVTIYHPTGTCKMGTDDVITVFEGGVDCLRVADASIARKSLVGRNAPAIMIGEKRVI